MNAVADSSPLIIFSKIGCFDLLNRLFPVIYVSAEVHDEVVVTGSGLPGASELESAEWIKIVRLKQAADLDSERKKYGLGAGEMSTILLAEELDAAPALLDDRRARKLAQARSLPIIGSIGLLETLYARRYLVDLRSAFRQLIAHDAYIDARFLNVRLQRLGLPPL